MHWPAAFYIKLVPFIPLSVPPLLPLQLPSSAHSLISLHNPTDATTSILNTQVCILIIFKIFAYIFLTSITVTDKVCFLVLSVRFILLVRSVSLYSVSVTSPPCLSIPFNKVIDTINLLKETFNIFKCTHSKVIKGLSCACNVTVLCHETKMLPRSNIENQNFDHGGERKCGWELWDKILRMIKEASRELVRQAVGGWSWFSKSLLVSTFNFLIKVRIPPDPPVKPYPLLSFISSEDVSILPTTQIVHNCLSTNPPHPPKDEITWHCILFC